MNTSENGQEGVISSTEFEVRNKRRFRYGRDLNYTCIQGPARAKSISEKQKEYLERAKIDFSNEEKLNEAIAKL